MYIYIYIKRTSKYMVWIKGPGPHAIHTPRSIPQSSVIFHDSLLCFCYVILFLSPCSMVLLVCVCVFVWEAMEQRVIVIVQPAGGGSYLDCLTCSSGSPTKRLLQVIDMDSGRKIHVPAFHINSEVSCKGKRLSLEPPRRAC